MLEQNADLTNNQVNQFIIANVDPVLPYGSHDIGPGGKGGRVNVYKALQVASPGTALGIGKFGSQTSIVFQNLTSNSAAGNVAFWSVGGTDGITTTGGVLASGAGPTPLAGYDIVATGDFNGDGNADLVFQDTVTNTIAMWFTDPLNPFSVSSGAFISPVPAAGYHVVGTGDFNGDGYTDIVLQNQTTGQVAIWYMHGSTYVTGAFVPTIPGAGYNVVGVGDFNADGRPDLVFQNQNTGQIVVWYMNNTTYLGGGAVSVVPGANYRVAGVGDFIGDHQPDLVFQNTVTHRMIIWLMNGLNYGGGGIIH